LRLVALPLAIVLVAASCVLPELEPEPTAEEVCNDCVGSACRSESMACDEACQSQSACLQSCEPTDEACGAACAPGAEAVAVAECIAANCANECGG